MDAVTENCGLQSEIAQMVMENKRVSKTLVFLMRQERPEEAPCLI
jgi:hypothetical protein